jgi:glycosyltransferase involved in cell wall biosynthesis
VFTVYDLSFWIYPEYTTEPTRLMCQEGVLRALGRAAAFVFISAFAKRDFERVLPGFISRTNVLTHVVRLGSRYSVLASRVEKEDTAPWLFAGSVEPRKNLEALLDAIVIYWRSSRQRRKLVLAGGRGWNSQGLWKIISDLQDKGLVEHLGYVSDEALQALYQKSFALVFPSYYEGFGLPVVEAMSQSCPVICPSHSSLAEAGGNAAFYVKDLTAESLVGAMLALESQPELHASLTEAGLALSRLFSWDTEALKLRTFYQEVVQASASR